MTIDVRKGDTVRLHGRAIIDGRTDVPAVVTGTGSGDGEISCNVDRGNGHHFDVPGIARYGLQADGSNWWEWPEEGAPKREGEGDSSAPAAADVDAGKSPA